MQELSDKEFNQIYEDGQAAYHNGTSSIPTEVPFNLKTDSSRANAWLAGWDNEYYKERGWES